MPPFRIRRESWVPARRAWRPGRRPSAGSSLPRATEGRPANPDRKRARLPGHRAIRKEDHRGIGEAERGPHLLLLARDATGWRSLCRLVSRANLAGRRPCRRSPSPAGGACRRADRAVGLPPWRVGPAAAAPAIGRVRGRWPERYARLFGRAGGVDRGSRREAPGDAASRPGGAASSSSSRTTCNPTTTGSHRRQRASRTSSACRSSCPTTSTTRCRRAASCRTC